MKKDTTGNRWTENLTPYEIETVYRFYENMVKVLNIKAPHKTSWLNGNVSFEMLNDKLIEEIGEALIVLHKVNPNITLEQQKKELIDVANLCMMLWSRL